MKISDRFKNQVISEIPESGFIDSYFYLKPVDHVLSGFYLEKIRNNIYISRYCYPLFDRSDRLNLNFSERIKSRNSVIDLCAEKGNEFHKEFLRIIYPYLDEAIRYLDIYKLFFYIKNNDFILGNEWVRKSYALMLVIMEEYEEAGEIMRSLLRENFFGERRRIVEDCKVILELLLSNPENAKKLVLSWESEMKLRLGIL